MTYTDTNRDEMTLSGATMGTRYFVQIPKISGANAKNLNADLQNAVDQVDQQMSPWIAGSTLNHFNKTVTGQWIGLPRQFFEVLVESLDIETASNGAFTPAIGPNVAHWGFSASKEGDGPEPGAPIRASSAIKIEQSSSAVCKIRPVIIDLCGIAKGYGVDELCRVLEGHGFSDHISSIDGEVRCSGLHPGGHVWQIALEAPEIDERRTRYVLECHDLSIATSGGYRQFRKSGGQVVTHIINPESGKPCREILSSVSVAARRCSTADAWATALQVLGFEAGAKLADAKGLSALFVNRFETVATGAMKSVL